MPSLEARPSKLFFFHHFDQDMRLSVGRDWGADIASAHRKHHPSFQTKYYLGIDLSAKLLAQPRGNAGRSKERLLLADIRRPGLRAQSLDFVVSTHTLSHLAAEDRFATVAGFGRLLRPDGVFLFNTPYTSPAFERDVDDLLDQDFLVVKKLRYRNKVTQLYEQWLSDRDGALTLDGVGRVRRRLLGSMALLVAQLEFVEPMQATGNMLYYCAQNKKG
jgi:SAM-dependent methyltransferase